MQLMNVFFFFSPLFFSPNLYFSLFFLIVITNLELMDPTDRRCAAQLPEVGAGETLGQLG